MTVGKVWLIGAGPGDPGLITVAGHHALAAADVVVYDRLVSPWLLEHARPDAERVYVGKATGSHALSQEEINSLLVDRARRGKRVARLKGGDPFVFGRGGEEAERLAEEGIPFEVIPGVTSAVAVPAYAGIPVTHREAASSFAVVTGHEDPAKDGSSINWEQLATAADTLVFLMGVGNLPFIVEQLSRHGRDPRTPVACIRWGTTTQQETVTGTLADIVARVAEAGLQPPVVTVVGDVVRLRDRLRWFDNRPLFGRRVLVTRTRRQASALSDLLRGEGAEPVELPAIEVRETAAQSAVDAAIDRLTAGAYAWVVFTSANGVEAFFGHLRRRGRDARAFGGSRVCVIGPGTAAALERFGLTPDLLPGEYIAEAVVAALTAEGVGGQAVLVPRAEGARPELVEGLAAVGAAVDEVPLYVAAPPAAADPEILAMIRRGQVDAVTFASSSTVRNLHRLLGGDWSGLEGAVVACIGPVTARTARELGLRVDVVAAEHSIPGLVEALREHFARKERSRDH